VGARATREWLAVESRRACSYVVMCLLSFRPCDGLVAGARAEKGTLSIAYCGVEACPQRSEAGREG
jgi:hypothetical protein